MNIFQMQDLFLIDTNPSYWLHFQIITSTYQDARISCLATSNSTLL